MAAASAAFVPAALLIAVARILRNSKVFTTADLVVVAPHTAYGHTITAPDVARRLFPNKRIAFVLFSDYRLHNSKLPLLWTNPRFVSLPVSFEMNPRVPAFRLPGLSSHKDFIRNQVMKLVRTLIRKDVEIIPRLEDLYARVTIPELDFDRNTLILNYLWPIGYFDLLKNTTAESVHLPESIRSSIAARLNKGNRKTCTLYLRQKSESAADYHNSRRCGSPLVDYLQAVQFLNARGYQVLVAGDVVFPKAVTDEFCGTLMDAVSAQVDSELFALYAATECDIFVGDPGGGIWLPGLNNIPRLLINAFPYFFGLPNSWVNYKTLRDGEGRLVHYSRLFTEFAHEYDLAGYTLLNNSATEILRAVETFLQDLANPENPDPGREILKKVPDFIWAKRAGTRICRTWLNLFDAQLEAG